MFHSWVLSVVPGYFRDGVVIDMSVRGLGAGFYVLMFLIDEYISVCEVTSVGDFIGRHCMPWVLCRCVLLFLAVVYCTT